MPLNKSILLVAVGATLASLASAQNTVYSNNPTPGDFFSNAGSTPANQTIGGFTGPNGEVFTYRETKNGGAVGVNTNFADNGNGSAWIYANGTNSKSEIAMSTSFSAGGDSTGVLGAFDALSAWSADLYTANSTIGNAAPVVRLELFSANDGGSSSYGSLIFDTSWTPGHYGTFTYGAWHNVDFLGNAANTWLRATSGIEARYAPGVNNDERTLADWMSLLAGKGYGVLSMNAGIGTIAGAATYEGATDNWNLGFGTNVQSFNFEAAPVPEPASMAILGLGVIAFMRRRRAR